MTFNPLNWTAGPFLSLSMLVVLTVVAAVLVARHSIGLASVHNESGDLRLRELAWLSGGLARAADTVLLGFLIAEAALVEPIRREIHFSPEIGPLPDSIAAFRSYAAGITTREQFRREISSDLDSIHDALTQRGFAPGAADLAWVRSRTWTLLAAPLLLGTAKIVVGSARGKPVGILIILVLLTAGFALVCSRLPPRLTWAGRHVLRHAASSNARAIRAPLGHEMALAFAMSGSVVLTGTAFETFAKLLRRQRGDGGGCSASAGCGGGAGGGGGNGCGGCSAGD